MRMVTNNTCPMLKQFAAFVWTPEDGELEIEEQDKGSLLQIVLSFKMRMNQQRRDIQTFD